MSFGRLTRYVALGACLALAGCGAQNRINALEVGMSKSEVLAKMGPPEKREAYGVTEFLLYRTSENVYDELGLTPVAIVDGRVAGWGRNYYTNIIKADITVRKQ